MPERKVNIGAQVPTWEVGVPQYQRFFHNFWRYALEGYSRNELVFTCVEALATSAAEPRLVGVRKTKTGTEQVKDHPIVELFESPNPFMSRFSLMANLVMFRAISGNAYLSKTRSAGGKVVQLWPLRPDRVWAIPHPEQHIGGWEYRLEHMKWDVPFADILQTRTRNAMDDYYGLPPLAVCAERVDTDAMMRSFTLSFFRNAAVPAGLLNITKQVNQAERQVIRDKLRQDSGGPQNWHQLMILDNTEATYVPMSSPMKDIVLPDLDEISEARIAMAFGVPLEIIGARLGRTNGNRATHEAAQAMFWDNTLIPLYSELAADLWRGMKDEPGMDDLDYIEFDLSTVRALMEDEDALYTRIIKAVGAGLMSTQEARARLGHDPEYAPDALLMLNRGIGPMQASAAEQGMPAALGQQPGAPPGQPGLQPPKPTGNGNGNGYPKLTPADLQALAELASGRDE